MAESTRHRANHHESRTQKEEENTKQIKVHIKKNGLISQVFKRKQQNQQTKRTVALLRNHSDTPSRQSYPFSIHFFLSTTWPLYCLVMFVVWFT